MGRSKISIIGGGFVGSTCAHWLLTCNLGDIVLIDLQSHLAKGRALDLLQSSPLAGVDSNIKGSGDYKDITGSDIVVITAGAARKPGMSRSDLQKINAGVVKEVCGQVKKYAPKCFVIVVTNPLDVMCWQAWKTLNFPPQRVMGMAGVLDSARFRLFAAQELNVSVQDVQAFVLGGHGDAMVPFPRLCHVGGIPLTSLLSPAKVTALVERAKNGGAEIVSLLKTGSAYFAPALSVVKMAEAVLKDQKRVLACSAYLNGAYGIKNLFMGVLCCLGKRGVEKIMEFSLTPEETTQFQKSAQTVQKQVQQLLR